MFPLTGNLYRLHGCRVECSTKENACAVLSRGQLSSKPVINVNENHSAAGHSKEVVLGNTAGQEMIVLEGKLLE